MNCKLKKKELSKCQKLDPYFSFSQYTTSSALKAEPSENLLPAFIPEDGDRAIMIALKDLLEFTFGCYSCTNGVNGRVRNISKLSSRGRLQYSKIICDHCYTYRIHHRSTPVLWNTCNISYVFLTVAVSIQVLNIIFRKMKLDINSVRPGTRKKLKVIVK